MYLKLINYIISFFITVFILSLEENKKNASENKSFGDKKPDIIILSIFSLLILITRIPFMSKYLYEWDSVNYALGFENKKLEIPLNASTTRIIWAMNNKTEFFKNVNSKLNTTSIILPNGLKIYYSDIDGAKSKSLSFLT